MVRTIKRFVPILLIIIGAGICLNGVALFFVSNINFGNFLTVALGGAIILVVALFKRLTKLLRVIVIFILIIAIVFSAFLVIYGKSDSVTHKEDAIIVLGAAVHGKTISRSLKNRLDTAAEYRTQNPDVLIIVSGGKGQGEDITEAEAMEKYLLEKGVPKQNILKEDKATSTYQNFLYSKEILTERFDKNFSVAFVTNEFHIFRARLCANRAGIENITHIHSDTTPSYLISGVLRECLAVVKYAVFKS